MSSKIVNSFFWKLLERVLAQGISFVVQVVLARILLPEDFANLAIIAAIANYATIFIQSGLSVALIQKENLEKEDVSTLLIASLATASFFYLIVFFIAPVIANAYSADILKPTLRVLGIMLFLNAINSIQLAMLQREMKFKQIFIRSIIAVPIAGAISIVMAIKGLGLWALVSYNVINAFLMVTICFLTNRLKVGWKFSWARAKTLYSFSVKILFASLISGLYDTTRTFVVGKKYSKDDLAYYDKAYTYSSYIVQVVSYSISTVVLPVLSRQQSDIELVKSTTRRAVSMSCFIMFPILLGIALVSKPLVLLLLTDKWADCAIFLALFCLLRIPESIIAIDKQAYYAIGKSGICLIYEIILCAMNFAALFSTLYFGVIYIAIGAVCVEYIALIIIFIISWKTYGYSFKDRFFDLLKPTISSLLMCGCVYLVGLLTIGTFKVFLLQVVCGIIIYFLSSFLIKDRNLFDCLCVVKNIFKRKEKV